MVPLGHLISSVDEYYSRYNSEKKGFFFFSTFELFVFHTYTYTYIYIYIYMCIYIYNDITPSFYRLLAVKDMLCENYKSSYILRKD